MPKKKRGKDKLSNEALQLIAQKFKSLADPARLQILQELKEKTCNGKELIERTGLTQSTVSKHLKNLFEHHIVERHQEGSTIYYSICDESVFEICELVCSKIMSHLKQQQLAFR